MDFPTEGNGSQPSGIASGIDNASVIPGTSPIVNPPVGSVEDISKLESAVKDATTKVQQESQIVGVPTAPINPFSAEVSAVDPLAGQKADYLNTFSPPSSSVDNGSLANAAGMPPVGETPISTSPILTDEKPSVEASDLKPELPVAEVAPAPEKTPAEVFQEEVAEVFKLGVEEQKKGLDQAAAKLLETIKQNKDKITFS